MSARERDLLRKNKAMTTTITAMTKTETMAAAIGAADMLEDFDPKPNAFDLPN